MDVIHTLPYYLPREDGSVLTGILEIDWEVLLRLDGKDLLSMCTTNTYIAEVCNDPTFWKRKIAYEYNDNVASQILPQGMTYKEYYQLLSREGRDITDVCLGTFRWRFCEDNDFWRKKVSRTFGASIAQLNTMGYERIGDIILVPYFRQYTKLWVWYTGIIDDPLTAPINMKDIKSLIPYGIQGNEDVILWLMYFDMYHAMIVDTLENLFFERSFDNLHTSGLFDLVALLYEEGVINKDNALALLDRFTDLIVMSNDVRLTQTLINMGMLKDMDTKHVALSAARAGNVYLLGEMYEFGYYMDLEEIKRVLLPNLDTVYENVYDPQTIKFIHTVLDLPLTDQLFDNLMLATIDPETSPYYSITDLRNIYSLGVRPGPHTFSSALNFNVGTEILDYLLEIDTPTENINPNHVDVDSLDVETIAWLRRNKFTRRFGNALAERMQDLNV